MQDKHFDLIIKLLESNEDLIHYDYNKREDQILLHKGLIEKLLFLVEKIKPKNSDAKELVKLSIRKAFELSDSDILISKNGHYFIKFLDENAQTTVEEKDKDTIANRYNGFSEEELKSFHREFFAEEENKDFFKSIAKEFTQKYFNERNVDNNDYEKNVFAYLHSITFDRLTDIYDDSDGFFKGFAGYVFRLHFKEVFENVADIILDEIATGNKNVIEFLKYYSLDVVVLNGSKYKVPSIKATASLNWNVGSMLLVAKTYTKAKRSALALQKSVLEDETEISKLYVNGRSPMEHHKSSLREQRKVETKLTDAYKKLEKYVNSLEASKNANEKEEIRVEIVEVKRDALNLKNQKESILKRMVKQSVIQRYSHLQKELDSSTRQLKREKMTISQNRESYFSIRESLVKALISKKQLLK